MASPDKSPTPHPAPRLYLVTPRVEDAAAFAAPLTAALGAGDVAAVLLRLKDANERSLINRIKSLAPIVQGKDAALIVEHHADLVARAGADGAHLIGIDAFNAALPTLKPERIAGCGGLASRHDAMVAAEHGADYVMFGEPRGDGSRPAFEQIVERVSWWAEVFQIPCVAYAVAANEVAPLVGAGADFIALGDFVWYGQVAAQVADAARCLNHAETTA